MNVAIMMGGMSTYPVGAAATTFEIVEALAIEGEVGVTALADELGRSKGSVHDHLTTLERLGYVVSEDGTYRLGLKFLDVGCDVRARESLYRVGREEVRRLANSSGETASLVVEEDGEAVYVYMDGDLDGPLRVGSRVPLASCAAGRAILANRPGTEVDLALGDNAAGPPEEDIVDREALRSELQSVRDQGLAFDRGDLDADRWAVAAPVPDDDGHAVGALVVSGPTDRMSGKRLEEDMPGLVLSSANAVSVELSRK